MLVHIFEANPEMIKIIKKNKKKIENFKKLKIKNFIINNLVVSDKNEYFNFNIAKNPTVSHYIVFQKISTKLGQVIEKLTALLLKK